MCYTLYTIKNVIDYINSVIGTVGENGKGQIRLKTGRRENLTLEENGMGFSEENGYGQFINCVEHFLLALKMCIFCIFLMLKWL